MNADVENLPLAAPHAGMDALFLADHPVLDMLNTVAVVEEALVDFWQTDADVLRWLEKQGMAAPAQGRWPGGALAASARRLRDLARELVTHRKAKKSLQGVDALNAFLAKGSSHLELSGAVGRSLKVERRYAADTPEGLLAPLAESVAHLLAEGDFNLVRRCEGEGCVLWFYDRTKAHRRRWCSMGICGNRAKVAAFRQRQQS
ncbi:MAG TPA: ABATE domain-containing protein [Terracidiphilus sp.]|nr:ABATE domain-containing protein [Terracidiphilus sp.]